MNPGLLEKNLKSQNSSSMLCKLFPETIALLFPILFPTGHILLFSYLWDGIENGVDREKCTCSCWDTVFKGPYESGVGRYKHMYFNGTINTFKIWTITVIAVIIMYECFKKLVSLTVQRKLRFTMGFLFLSSIFSHYYAWWGMVNYYNDDFYDQWYHQLLFTISEIVTTYLVVKYLDRTKPTDTMPLLVIGNIAFVHILIASRDQFIRNVILREGRLHQVLRDLFFMSTDLIYLTVSTYELRKYSKLNGQSIQNILKSKKNNLVALLFLSSIVFIVSIL